MCIRPYGEFELVRTEMTGPAEGIYSLWHSVFAPDAY